MASGEILQFPLRLGLAEDANPKAQPTSSLRKGINIRWPKDGQLGKRLGTETLPTSLAGGGSLPRIRRFIVRGRELSVTNGERIYTYNEGSSDWLEGPRLSEAALEWTTHVDGIEGVATADSAALSDGTVVDVWTTGDPTIGSTRRLIYQIRDVESGALLTPPTELSTTISPRIRLVASGTTWFALAVEAGALKAFTAGATTTLQTDAVVAVGNLALDACVFGSSFVVAYSLAAGGIGLCRYSFAATPALQASGSVSGESSTGIQSISIAGEVGESLYITYFDVFTSAIKRACANPSTLSQTVTPANVEVSSSMVSGTVAAVRVSPTSCLLVYSFMSADVDAGVMRTVSIDDTGTVSSGQSTVFLRPLSRPFQRGERFYVIAATDILASSFSGAGAISTSDTFLVDVTYEGSSGAPFREVGKLDVWIGGAFYRGFTAEPSLYSSTTAYVAVPYQSTVAPGRTGWRQGLRFVRVTTGEDLPTDMWRSVQLGPEAYVSGAMLTAWDGVDAIGYGWPHGPYIDPNNTTAASSGGSIANGSYVYNVTAERRSAVGMLHRAPLGVSVTKTVTGPSGSVTVAIAPASLGRSERIPGHYPVYRTEANGSVLYRLTVEPGYATKLESGPIGYPVTLVDTAANTAGSGGVLELTERPQPYTATGELEDVQPPAQYSLHLHGRRLGIITGGRREYWYSKDANENPGIAPGFNPTQIELYDEDLVGCASMDEKRIMFSERRIWFVAGDGPTVAGTDNRFTSPQLIQSDVGCTNPRSIVEWPFGVMFQWGSDIYNLTRGLQVEWIGKDSRETLATYSQITSAVLVPAENEVRFTCNGAPRTYGPTEDGGYGWTQGDPEGRIVVFDYARNTWSVRTYPGNAPIVDATLHDGSYVFATESEVRRELADLHTDDGDYVTSEVVFAPIAAAGPLSWHRVRRIQVLGASLSNHALTISVARDWSDDAEQSRTFVAGSDTTTPGPLERAEIHPAVQKVQAIEIRVSDAAPANTASHPLSNGAGFTLEGVALLVQPKQGLARITPSRRG